MTTPGDHPNVAAAPAGCEPEPIGASLEHWFATKIDGEPSRALTTGLHDLDALTTGCRAGELVLIAARPSTGTTVLGLKLARHTAIREGLPALVFSPAMSRSELLDRVVSAETGVDHDRIRNKQLTNLDQQRIRNKLPELASAPLYVEDDAPLSTEQIKATAQTYRRRNGVELIVIDAPTTGGNTTRERQVAEMSRAAKLLAKELAIPVVLTMQLNRASAQRPDPTPRLDDLGKVESLDAHQVWLLHRPEFGATTEQLNRGPEAHRLGELRIIVAHNRGHQTGDRWFRFLGHRQDILDAARPERAASCFPTW
ncbi:DnaB-like helicase C-terminal domain-containing protein [Saccharopolyspora cebuensis]|uniref:DnaB-like helicase C-terminal domain-containing protein n=1 Tax=Saccharopolyspora cebuensis TaxID=418759 RepID=UPI0031EA8314